MVAGGAFLDGSMAASTLTQPPSGAAHVLVGWRERDTSGNTNRHLSARGSRVRLQRVHSLAQALTPVKLIDGFSFNTTTTLHILGNFGLLGATRTATANSSDSRT